MRQTFRNYISSLGFITGLSVIVFGLVALSHSPVATASVPVCHAAMVFDRSASVGNSNETTLKAQIERLFEPGGLYTDNVQLAFWSFSSIDGGSTTGGAGTGYNANNYNAPFYTFVTSKGHTSGFDTALQSIEPDGGTSYQEGFGFKGYDRFAAVPTVGEVMNPYDNINKTINGADIIVFLTDGTPNTPGVGDDNTDARNAGRYAAKYLEDSGKIVIAGLVQGQGVSQSTINYVLNGSTAKATDANGEADTFQITADYTNLLSQLNFWINKKCSEILTPPTSANYSLTPIVSSNDRVASGATTATIDYSVFNGSNSASKPTNWQIDRLQIPPTQSANPLEFGGAPYKDGQNCSTLLNLVGNHGSCQDSPPIAQGNQAFESQPQTTSLDAAAGTATTAVIDDSLAIGTKICYVLVVHQPTQDASVTDRASKAVCVTIGKHPTVQVIGGDLRVGRHFSGDDTTNNASEQPSQITTSVTVKSDGKTYGSWVEYGASAPGPITGFASASGLQGGYNSNASDTQQFWSKLTFGNVQSDFGHFTDTNTGEGTIPNYASAILAGKSVVSDLSGTNVLALQSGHNETGVYQKESGDISLGTSTLGKGESVILNVPNGTVTISGNISYDNGPYSNISQIPQLVIIAKTINIDPGVANVDAWLIANSADDGTVSTCDDPATLTISVCNQELTINGPIMARHLNLRRTAGSGIGGASADPAEVINMPGTSYLWSQSEGESNVRAQTSFTTELPPYF